MHPTPTCASPIDPTPGRWDAVSAQKKAQSNEAAAVDAAGRADEAVAVGSDGLASSPAAVAAVEARTKFKAQVGSAASVAPARQCIPPTAEAAGRPSTAPLTPQSPNHAQPAPQRPAEEAAEAAAAAAEEEEEEKEEEEDPTPLPQHHHSAGARILARRLVKAHLEVALEQRGIWRGRRSLLGACGGVLGGGGLLDAVAVAWKLQTQGHGGAVGCLCISADERRLFTSEGGPQASPAVLEWDVVCGEVTGRFEGHLHPVTALACTADSQLLISGDAGTFLRVWSVLDRSCLYALSGASAAQVSALALFPITANARSVQFLFSAGGSAVNDAETPPEQRDNRIRKWVMPSNFEYGAYQHERFASGLQRPELLRDQRFDGHARWVRALELSADGYHLFSCSDDGTIIKFDALLGVALLVMRGHGVFDDYVPCTGLWSQACPPPDVCVDDERFCHVRGLAVRGDVLYSIGNDWTLRAWDVDRGRQLYRHEGHGGAVTTICHGGGCIFTGGVDGWLHQWAAADVTGIGRERGHPVSSYRVAGSGEVAATGIAPRRREIFAAPSVSGLMGGPGEVACWQWRAVERPRPASPTSAASTPRSLAARPPSPTQTQTHKASRPPNVGASSPPSTGLHSPPGRVAQSARAPPPSRTSPAPAHYVAAFTARAGSPQVRSRSPLAPVTDAYGRMEPVYYGAGGAGAGDAGEGDEGGTTWMGSGTTWMGSGSGARSGGVRLESLGETSLLPPGLPSRTYGPLALIRVLLVPMEMLLTTAQLLAFAWGAEAQLRSQPASVPPPLPDGAAAAAAAAAAALGASTPTWGGPLSQSMADAASLAWARLPEGWQLPVGLIGAMPSDEAGGSSGGGALPLYWPSVCVALFTSAVFLLDAHGVLLRLTASTPFWLLRLAPDAARSLLALAVGLATGPLFIPLVVNMEQGLKVCHGGAAAEGAGAATAEGAGAAAAQCSGEEGSLLRNLGHSGALAILACFTVVAVRMAPLHYDLGKLPQGVGAAKACGGGLAALVGTSWRNELVDPAGPFTRDPDGAWAFRLHQALAKLALVLASGYVGGGGGGNALLLYARVAVGLWLLAAGWACRPFVSAALCRVQATLSVLLLWTFGSAAVVARVASDEESRAVWTLGYAASAAAVCMCTWCLLGPLGYPAGDLGRPSIEQSYARGLAVSTKPGAAMV